MPFYYVLLNICNVYLLVMFLLFVESHPEPAHRGGRNKSKIYEMKEAIKCLFGFQGIDFAFKYL